MDKLYGDSEVVWSFERIVTHQGPLAKGHPDYKGNPFHVVVEWSNGEQSSEFVAARTCVEQVINLRNTLHYLGVPIQAQSYMFGDNKSVVESSTHVHAKLHKRHNMLSFHRVREAVASGMIKFSFISGKFNPADILSKHWGYVQVWDLLRPLLFWAGDTLNVEARKLPRREGE
jgi:hypothetical protein